MCNLARCYDGRWQDTCETRPDLAEERDGWGQAQCDPGLECVECECVPPGTGGDGDADVDADVDADADSDGGWPTESSIRCPLAFTGYDCVQESGLAARCPWSSMCERTEDVAYEVGDPSIEPDYRPLEREFNLQCPYHYDPIPDDYRTCDWTFHVQWAVGEPPADTAAWAACDNPGAFVEVPPAHMPSLAGGCASNSLSYRAAVLVDCRWYEDRIAWLEHLGPVIDDLLLAVEAEALRCP